MDDLTEARSDPAFWDSSAPSHAASVQKVADILAEASGQEPSEVITDIKYDARPIDERMPEMMAAADNVEEIDVTSKLNLPEGFEFDQAEAEQVQDWLYSAEISQPEIDGFVDLYSQALTWDDTRIEQEKVQALASLDFKYGDKREKALHLAYSAANSISPDFVNYLDLTGLGNRFEVIETLINFARRKGHEI